jgi:hypothetical protein
MLPGTFLLQPSHDLLQCYRSPTQPVDGPADAVDVRLPLLARERPAIAVEVRQHFLQTVGKLAQAGDARRNVLGSPGNGSEGSRPRRRLVAGLSSAQLGVGHWGEDKIAR